MEAYTEEKIGTNVYLRTFSSLNARSFVWHRDREDRRVDVVESGQGWMIQHDNQLPIKLEPGQTHEIKSMTFHRIIAGEDNLVLRITKLS